MTSVKFVSLYLRFVLSLLLFCLQFSVLRLCAQFCFLCLVLPNQAQLCFPSVSYFLITLLCNLALCHHLLIIVSYPYISESTTSIMCFLHAPGSKCNLLVSQSPVSQFSVSKFSFLVSSYYVLLPVFWHLSFHSTIETASSCSSLFFPKSCAWVFYCSES